MKLVWSAPAQADLHALTAYYRAIDPELSVRIRPRIEQTPALLTLFPQSGTALRGSGLRKLRVRHTPFILFYRVTAVEVIVLRVLHAARDIDL